jgi:phage protein U
MLGMIDEFEFKMSKVEFQRVSHVIEYGWIKSDRIANHPKHQAVKLSEETFSFSGDLILQSIKAFDKLNAIAAKHEPVVLNWVDESAVMVVIKKISKDMSRFLNTGEYIQQGFNIELERWYK